MYLKMDKVLLDYRLVFMSSCHLDYFQSCQILLKINTVKSNKYAMSRSFVSCVPKIPIIIHLTHLTACMRARRKSTISRLVSVRLLIRQLPSHSQSNELSYVEQTSLDRDFVMLNLSHSLFT